MFFVWDDKYKTGIESLDKHHQKLFSIVNEIYDAVNKGKGNNELEKSFKELLDYTMYHFTAEENLLKEHGFNGYEVHKLKHEKMLEKIISLKDEFYAGKITITLEVMKFLKGWINKHILETDKNYGAFLRSKGCQ